MALECNVDGHLARFVAFCKFDIAGSEGGFYEIYAIDKETSARRLAWVLCPASEPLFAKDMGIIPYCKEPDLFLNAS
jgi:hypothetical protein